MELDTVAMHVDQFYRLVGTESGDQDLERQGESADDVAYIFLTRGCRKAQRWMLRNGYQGWRKRSGAIAWSGTDSADGGRYVDLSSLASDFLRAYGSVRRSCLTEADGDAWGQLVAAEEDHLKGDYFYFRGDELWLARTANPPSTLYLEYHYLHPEWTSGVTIKFPMEARPLIPAEAAGVAMDDDWLPGGQELQSKIVNAVMSAREEARHVARTTRGPRTFRKPTRYGNRW